MERMLMDSTSASPELNKANKIAQHLTGNTDQGTPYGTPVDGQVFEFPPSASLREELGMEVTEVADTPDQPARMAPAGSTNVEAVLQSIHSSIQRTELKLNMLTDTQADLEDKLTSKLTSAFDKMVERLPSIVDGVVDKKLGAVTKTTNDRIDSVQEQMEKNNKAVMEEIQKLKKATTRPTVAANSGKVDNLVKKV